MAAGEGYFRVVTNYSDDDTFDQDIRIEKINNPFSVYLDPDHQRIDGSDAKYAFVTQLISKEDFKERYGKEPTSTDLDVGVGDDTVFWTEDEKVRIAEYWEITQEEREVSLLTNGETVFFEDLDEIQKAQLQAEGVTVKKTRSVNVPKVTQYIIDGKQVLEQNDWAGKYIPIVKVTGDELWIEGKRYTSGLVRPAKDAQRMYNYWRTHATELVALAQIGRAHV